jgi:hypothetical protein
MNEVSNYRIKRLTLSLLCLLLMAVFAPKLTAAGPGGTEQNASVADATGDTTQGAQTKRQIVASLIQLHEHQSTLNTLIEARSNADGIRQEVANARVLRTLNQLVSISHSTARTYLNADVDAGNLDS